MEFLRSKIKSVSYKFGDPNNSLVNLAADLAFIEGQKALVEIITDQEKRQHGKAVQGS